MNYILMILSQTLRFEFYFSDFKISIYQAINWYKKSGIKLIPTNLKLFRFWKPFDVPFNSEWSNRLFNFNIKVNMTKDEEIKQLKKELELVRKNTRANVETLDNMYWENVDLKKENKELQRENDALKIRIEAKDKAYMDLLADYNYQRARIRKTERAFIKYKEKLEKLEVDLDMVVMNR